MYRRDATKVWQLSFLIFEQQANAKIRQKDNGTRQKALVAVSDKAQDVPTSKKWVARQEDLAAEDGKMQKVHQATSQIVNSK